MRELCATVTLRGRSDGVADMPLPVRMQAHLISVVDVVAKLDEVLLAQGCPALPKDLGRAVPFETMLLNEPAPHALLLDVTAALGDERGKDGTVVRRESLPLRVEYVVLVVGAGERFFGEPPSNLGEHGILVDRWLRVDDERRHRALKPNRGIPKRQNWYSPSFKELAICQERNLLVYPYRRAYPEDATVGGVDLTTRLENDHGAGRAPERIEDVRAETRQVVNGLGEVCFEAGCGVDLGLDSLSQRLLFLPKLSTTDEDQAVSH